MVRCQQSILHPAVVCTYLARHHIFQSHSMVLVADGCDRRVSLHDLHTPLTYSESKTFVYKYLI